MIQPIPVRDADAASLARAARRGCSASFATLLRRHRTDILKALHRQLSQSFDPDELLQDVAVRAFRALPELRDPTRVSIWLIRIAQNASIDWVRRRQVLDRVTPLEFDPPDPGPRRGMDHGAIVAEACLPSLVEEIARLNPRHAAAILLRGLEGMTYVEIADRLRMSTSCLKTCLHRARRRLRNRMAATWMKDLHGIDPVVPRDDLERNGTS